MILQCWIHVIIHLPKPVECVSPAVDPNVYHGLWVTVTCQCRFIDCSKRTTTQVGAVDSGGGCTSVGAGCIWRSQFPCEPKTALKKIIKSIKKNTRLQGLSLYISIQYVWVGLVPLDSFKKHPVPLLGSVRVLTCWQCLNCAVT